MERLTSIWISNFCFTTKLGMLSLFPKRLWVRVPCSAVLNQQGFSQESFKGFEGSQSVACEHLLACIVWLIALAMARVGGKLDGINSATAFV